MTEEGVALAHALRRETGGNPFFVVELIRHLAENGTFVQGADGMWHLTNGLERWGSRGASERSWRTGWPAWAPRSSGRSRWPP